MLKDRKLLPRLITALTALPFIIAAIYYGGWAFFAFIYILGILCLNEFLFLARGSDKKFHFLDIIVHLAFILAMLSAYLPEWRWIWALLPVKLLTLGILFYFLLELLKEKIFLMDGNIKGAIRGIMYIGLLFPYYILIRELPEHGMGYLIFITFAIWFNDSWAYLVGLVLGKRKLKEKISPKKSVEGAWGGFIATLFFAAVFGPELGFTLVQAVVLGSVISIYAQASDLLESLFKRFTNAKDSSSLLPGHGGFLDRMDSFILSGPIYYFLIIYFCK